MMRRMWDFLHGPRSWAYHTRVSRWLLLCPALVACYAPAIPVGVPCGAGDTCPTGQTCVNTVCEAGDRRVDAGEPADSADGRDSDGDGIADSVDNCPDIANRDQANEDGDRFGDACDPCPPVADDAPADADGDGVADACDPNPQTPGDQIVLFEGFHQGVPSWSHSPNWTAATDAVRVASAAPDRVEFLALPLTNPDHITLSAQVVVEHTVSGAGDKDIDVVAPEDVSNDDGVDCELHERTNQQTTERLVWLFDDLGSTISKSLAWSNDVAYTLALTRKGTSFTCVVADPAKPPVTTTVTGTSSDLGGPQPAVVIRAYGLTARVGWVMIVRSP
jgi:hypothetical protein